MAVGKRWLLTFFVVFGFAAFACGIFSSDGPSDLTQPIVVEEQIVAAEGGEISHPAGATLNISPGALTQDATVSIRNHGFEQSAAEGANSLLNLSQEFTVDIGPAEMSGEVILELVYPSGTSFEMEPNHILFSHADSEGNRWLRAAELDERTHVLRRRVDDIYNDEDVDASSANTFVLEYVVPFTLVEPAPILQVPFYVQNGLNWCTPTALSMQFNYHNYPFGTASNWWLAGQSGMDQGIGGRANYLVMGDLNVSKDDYEFLYWDDNLISLPQPSAGDPDSPILFANTPFTSYVQWQIEGLDLRAQLGNTVELDFGFLSVTVDVPIVINDPRPVQLTADTANHAFVAVGADESSIWIHDSSGAFAPKNVAEQMSWATFRSSAFSNTRNDELRSIVINHGAKAESQRRGSLVLCQQPRGANECNTSNSSLRYTDDMYSGSTSFWRWDGQPYSRGYFWDDAGGDFPNDTDFGNAFPLAGRTFGTLSYDFDVANITAVERTYTVNIELRDSDGDTLHQQSEQVTVSSYTWNSPNVSGTIDTSPITQPGVYSIYLFLRESGELQDVKSAEFTVVEGEELPPVVEILTPIENASFLEGEAIPFLAEVTDYQRAAGDYTISWSYPHPEGYPFAFGSSQNGETLSVAPFCDGTYTVTAEAANPFTGQAGTDRVTITIEDLGASNPPPLCAPSVVIDTPRDGSTFALGIPILYQATIDDDHPETDAPIYPLIWRLGGPNGSEIGRGLTASTADLQEGTYQVYVEYGAASDQVTILVQAGENLAPNAEITEPADGDSFQYEGNVPVTFRGKGDDPEDGSLSGSALTWEYRQEGATTWSHGGNGSSVTITFPGSCEYIRYEVSLTVRDSNGAADSDTITIRARGPEC